MRAEPSDDGGAPQPLRSAGAAEEPASPYVRGVEGFGASSGKLEHLQGARCVATIFVLYHHDWYFSGGARSCWGRNGLAAVDFFVVLSGFATHWSNRRKRLELSPPERWLGWCLRRARKAVAAVWCTMALDAAVFLRYENWAGSGWLWFGGGGLVRAALRRARQLVGRAPHALPEQLVLDRRGPRALLVPRLPRRAAPRGRARGDAAASATAAAAVAVALAPVVLCLPAELARQGWADRAPSAGEDALQYALWCGLSGIPPDAAPRDRACFPLSVPLNFVVGVLAAALAASLDGRDARRGLVADAAAAAVLLAVVLMPSDVSKRRFPLARLWKNAFDPDPGASLFTFERFAPKTAAFLAALVACSAAYVDGVQPRLFGHKRKAL
ncbi:hypothetical protein JL720_8125 [Aureococcus anophagefferens]|nr:hypothetical protein JL720_8125 [Aureococcus anophagefferens]